MLHPNELKIVTCGRFASDFYDFIQANYPDIAVRNVAKSELAASLKWANCYAGFNELGDMVASHLQWIHSFGAGVDGFLSNASIADNQVLISRSTGDMGRMIGEYCLSHVLGDNQNLPTYYAQQAAATWKQSTPTSLKDANVLILGTGTIGSGIAAVFRNLTASVIGVNTTGSPSRFFDTCISFAEIDDICDSTDVVINALPLTSDTNGLLNESFFSKFREVCFVNVGRGKSISSEADLIAALDSGFLSYAVLDVFASEPLSSESLLWSHPRISITPHVSGLSSFSDITSGFQDGLTALLSEDHSYFVDITKGY